MKDFVTFFSFHPMRIVYAVVLAGYAALFLRARKEAVLTERRLSFAEKCFRRMAVYLYKRYRIFLLSHPRLARLGDIPLARRAREDLRTLSPAVKKKQRELDFLLNKMTRFLMLGFLAAALSLTASAMLVRDRVIGEDGLIRRGAYGDADREIALTEDRYGEFRLVLGARRYSDSELDVLAEEAERLLPEVMRGNNPDLLHVCSDLVLPSSLEGLPFVIRWESGLSELVDSRGHVHSDLLPEDGREEVMLTAYLTCDSRRRELSFTAAVIPEPRTEADRMRREIADAMEQAEEETAQEADYRLPHMVENVELSFREKVRDNSPFLFLILLSAGLAAFFAMDRDLHGDIAKREREMILDYPHIISKLALYLGAGMSMRRAFERIGSSYEEHRKSGEYRYAYEEILRALREMSGGIPESEAYERFGRRCRVRAYTRLSSLLMQNLKKGNDALLIVLQEEAQASYEERRGIAKQLGEEAGTKLLVPMVMMLAVTLVMIMVPAYLGFMG